MGKALYRKYRSRSLGEIVGQEHITAALDNALKQKTISHAYLFTGPRGTGKTSIARILAFEVNGLPYDEVRLPIDIIEIDAASNRRIDEIRDLRDKVHIAPASAKYKVYIIDEVHMLTREAFNALLKTLEEPPAHVIFILATTEVHKLPETIISRTQRYTFRPVERQKVVDHLRTIAKAEKIKISNDALALVAEHGDGSFRDSISLLDQISNLGKAVEAEDVLSLLGIAPAEAIEQLKNVLFNGTAKQVADELRTLRECGYEPASVAKQLGESLRTDLVNGSAHGTAITNLLAQLLDVPAAHNSEALLEIILLDFNLKNATPEQQTHTLKEKKQEDPPITKPVATAAKPTESVVEPAKEAVNKLKTKSVIAEPKPAAPQGDAKLENFWPQALESVKQRNNTLYGVLRMAVPAVEDGNLTLRFQFPFHQKRIKETKNLQILNDVIEQHLGRPLIVNCIVDKAPKATPAAPAPAADSAPSAPEAANPLAAITNIFGNAEVIES